jgi:hypothetical protein
LIKINKNKKNSFRKKKVFWKWNWQNRPGILEVKSLYYYNYIISS